MESQADNHYAAHTLEHTQQNWALPSPASSRTNLDTERRSRTYYNSRAFLQQSESTSPPVNQHSDPASSSIVGPSKQTHNSEPPWKRQKPNEVRMSYPRKRAVTACQVCRVRKSKCDNQRPICGSCAQLNAECIYQDQRSDMSSFDPASLAILDRLNYSIQLLESQAQTLARAEYLTSLQPQSHPSVESTDETGIVFSAPFNPVASVQNSADETARFNELTNDNVTNLGDVLAVAANCSSGIVLQWPIFEGAFESDDITTLFFDPDAAYEGSKDPRKMGPSNLPVYLNGRLGFGRGVHEEDVQMLISEFLQNVHVKNPILDSSSLKSIARQISEHGFGWDGPSCLVLITCALANLSAPFAIVRPGKEDESHLDAPDYLTAEAYYTAARKRIGLLGSSIMATQCHFLTGVYEMYSLRPLKAWLSFNRACTTFQAYLCTQSLQTTLTHSSRRLEQRLYWSCLKSECEIRDEIDLPPTGLATVDYPDLFPSPPDGTPLPEEAEQSIPADPHESASQQGWYYYLSEIALRRIANRITHALYKNESQSWITMPLKRIQRIADELDAQIIQWSENLPYALAFEEQTPSQELTFMLRARFLDLRERIWRPFLYLAIHQTSTEVDQLMISTYAQRSLDYSINLISLASIKHRHHGSWFGPRGLFTKSLLLLAAAKSRKIAAPLEWRSSVDKVITCLKYWQSEAPDLQAARTTLVSILTELDGCSGSI